MGGEPRFLVGLIALGLLLAPAAALLVGAPAPSPRLALPAPDAPAAVALEPAHMTPVAPGPTAAHGLAGDARGRTVLTGPLARFPPPHPIPARSGPPSYSGHYYAGSVYNGTNLTSHQLSAWLNVPLDPPQTGDFYYVILSAWDNASSYDQIGMANSGGAWGIAYSTTDYCANNYYYSPDAYPLSPGATYNFSMDIHNGVVDFFVTNTTGTLLWSLSQGSGGDYFVDSTFYSCNGTGPYYDYTDYEEIYSTTNDLVPYNWYFGPNLADNRSLSVGWGAFSYGSPYGVTTSISGADTTILNEPYQVVIPVTDTSYLLEAGGTGHLVKVPFQVKAIAPSPSVTVSAYSLPAGWGATFSVTSGIPTFSTKATVTVPANLTQGNYTVGLAAGNSSTILNQESLYFDVLPPNGLTVSAAPHGFLDLGQTVRIQANIVGGIGGLSYTWSNVPTGCNGTGVAFLCTPTATGTFPVSVVAQDSAGDTITSAPYSMTVFSDPTVTASVSAPIADVNQSVQWTAIPLAGSGGFSYKWSGLPVGCATTKASVTCKPPSAGTYVAAVRATDSAGFSVESANVSLRVAADPSVSLDVPRLTVDVGEPIQLVASGTLGFGNYTYGWTLPNGCAAVGAQATCSFPSAGGVYLSVTATDSAGFTSAPLQSYIQVTPDPVVLFAAQPASLDLGQSTALALVVSGGAPGYTYAFLHLPRGCVSANAATVDCQPSATGTYANVSATVTDANGYTVVRSINLTVFSDPVASLSASPVSVAAGATVTLTASVTGGAGGDTYAWTDLPGGCNPAPSATITCAPGGVGVYNVSVRVTDLDGGQGVAHLAFDVTSPPTFAPGAGAMPIVLVGGIVVAVVAIAAVVLLLRRRPRPSDEGPAEPEPPKE